MAVEFAQAVGNKELSPTPAEEVYSRKVFIGGLPLDSTAGKWTFKSFIFCFIYLSHASLFST